MNILDSTIISHGIYYIEDVGKNNDTGQRNIIDATFKNIGKTISKEVIKIKDDLPKEDLVFMVSCRIGKLSEIEYDK